MVVFVFFFEQKTAYELRISDWSADVCSSDLVENPRRNRATGERGAQRLRELAEAEFSRFGGFAHRGLDCLGRPVVQRAQPVGRSGPQPQMRRASSREGVCQYVSLSVVAVPFKNKPQHIHSQPR